MPLSKTSTDTSRKEALDGGVHLRVSDPTNLDADGVIGQPWEEMYRLFWKLKLLRGYYSAAGARPGRPTRGSVDSTAMVNHYYFYVFDDDFGPFFLKFCSYFPYNAKLASTGTST